ncbi:MAG: Hsp70 family protein [Austwickia sp.]|jgi:molecular chaperone DnaK (HSP70)|nr:MAG: Hsp70 family protein [Austwickia sp.]
MNLGIDFGTTRTIVAYADRGNYPVVSFFDADDDTHDFYPSVVSTRSGRLVCGFDALAAAAEGGPLVRSFKRHLAAPDVSGDTPVVVGDDTYRLLDVLIAYLGSVREALCERSSVADHLRRSGAGPVVVAVPAHAHGAQRFLTLEAFRRAGFDVTGMINEPSAAGFEYTHHRAKTVTARRTRVIVYDLGGGTFDASLVAVDGTNHDVLGSLGVNQLGGDDFDAVLVDCALATGKLTRETMTRRAYRQLVDECREAKEHLSPQSKRIALEVAGADVVVRTEDFYDRATELVEASIDAMAPLISGLDNGEPDLTDIAGIYLVGGASGLPLVPRLLRERFGRRVHRSPYPAASTAIGLAIAADENAGYSLHDRLSRGFGVFREAVGGRQLAFDPILDREEEVPSTGELSITRQYRAAHNIGWFRFVEYSDVDDSGQPRGDIMPFAEVLFPFDPALQERQDLRDVAVVRREPGPLIQETYTIDQHGIVQVRLADLDTGFEASYRLEATH